MVTLKVKNLGKENQNSDCNTENCPKQYFLMIKYGNTKKFIKSKNQT